MSRFSNVAHYQDFQELLGILSRSGNSYDMEKIKVALICHFSNTLVRDHLNLYGDNNKFFDFSNWITNIINGLKSRKI